MANKKYWINVNGHINWQVKLCKIVYQTIRYHAGENENKEINNDSNLNKEKLINKIF